MREENNQFIQSYIKLETILNKVFNDTHGISVYIVKMGQINGSIIENWSNDYNRLRKIRHIRNELVHSSDALNNDYGLKDDIAYLDNFYNRLLNQDDPLSRYYNYKKAVEEAKYKSNTVKEEKTIKNTTFMSLKKQRREEESSTINKTGLFIILSVFVVFIIACIVIFTL